MLSTKKLIISLLLLILCCSVSLAGKKINIDTQWYFALGDFKDAQKPNYDFSSWRKLNLPHDWSIEGEYQENNPGGASMGFLPGGIGWYKKVLDYDPTWNNQLVYIEFDGIYMNGEVWINDHYLGKRPNGYIGHFYDLSPYLNKGKNIITVKVDNNLQPSGRWYTGSGIYRHVWINICNPVHVARYGTTITTPEAAFEKSILEIHTTLENNDGKARNITLTYQVLDQQMKPVAVKSLKEKVSGKSNELSSSVEITQANLWSPESPNVYYLKTIVKQGKKVLDEDLARFGIRKLEFDAEGFKLNGVKTKFKGVANHQDAGLVGVAVPEDVLYYRLKLLKEMGCNAVRTAHHPFAPEFYAMCDTLGIMVMNDAFDGWDKPKAKYDYGLYWDDWMEEDLTDFIKRDRNHPSVMIWCIGNEVWGHSKSLQKQIAGIVRNLDPTRPLTQAHTNSEHLDIAGFNGNGEEKNALQEFHKEYPQKLAIGTEMTHTLQTRGIYRTKTLIRRRDNPAPWERSASWEAFKTKVYDIPDLSPEEIFPAHSKRYASGYDNHIVRIGVRDEYKHVRDYDFLLGDFRWTGFDYLGESFGWPARTDNFGVIDLAGFPKDHYYLYQSLWAEEPMIHLLPHWTHPGKEGIEIPVVAYTNAHSAELFLNGKSLGEKVMTDDLQIVWNVKYEPGILTAKAKNNGKVVAEQTVKTATSAHSFALKTDRNEIKANSADVVRIEVTVTDKDGTMVPEANNLLRFEVEGPVRVLGTENGDILDLTPAHATKRKAFNGKCLLLLQATDSPGKITVKTSGDGLEETIIELRSIL